jgi:hypothetical protein
VSTAETVGSLADAERRGLPVRLHMEDGEVLVARILHRGPREVTYAVVTSSRPEKYALCDATGFIIQLDAIRKASVLRGPSQRAGRRRGARRSPGAEEG